MNVLRAFLTFLWVTSVQMALLSTAWLILAAKSSFSATFQGPPLLMWALINYTQILTLLGRNIGLTFLLESLGIEFTPQGNTQMMIVSVVMHGLIVALGVISAFRLARPSTAGNGASGLTLQITESAFWALQAITLGVLTNLVWALIAGKM